MDGWHEHIHFHKPNFCAVQLVFEKNNSLAEVYCVVLFRGDFSSRCLGFLSG